jgi:tetratricopeptide (TPR) repeat protein
MLAVADVLEEPTARDLLLRPGVEHPAAQAHALGLYLRRFVRPGMPDPEAGASKALEELARSEDPDVQALALAALHLMGGGDPSIRSFLREQLEELRDRGSDVRRRWVLALRTSGDALLAGGSVDGAMTAYERALEVWPEHPGVLSDLGLAHAAAQRFQESVEYLDRSLTVDPYQSQVLVNRGVALENLGRGDEAIASYELAISRNPGEALAHFNLGNVRFVQGEFGLALEYYRASVRHNPRLVNGHLMLAQTFLLVGEPDSAVVSARNVLEFDPTNEPAQRMLADLVR